MRTKAIFLEALEINSDAEREAFLARTCDKQTQQRQSIEELLRSYEKLDTHSADSPAEKIFPEEAPVPEATYPAPGSNSEENGPQDDLITKNLRRSSNEADSRQTPQVAEQSPRSTPEVIVPSQRLLESPVVGFHPAGYRIQSTLGQGGMGTVFLAKQLNTNRLVAVKALSQHRMFSEEPLLRFRKEAEAIARLQHPNIVQIFEVGESDGVPYFSLEYCPLGSLESYLGKKVLSTEETLTIVLDLAKAVQAAHEANVLHRDLKPANILLVARDGSALDNPLEQGLDNCTIKLTDFGIAKIQGEEARTSDGLVVGTPAYMSPEQARGLEIGPESDVYAIGAILYELLTGKPPFLGSTDLVTMQMLLSEETVSPHRLNPRASHDLCTICLKCLNKEPRQRYPDAKSLAEDLERARDGWPILAKPIGPLGRTWRWVKRNRTVASLLLVVFLSLILGIVVSGWFYFQERAQSEWNSKLAAENARQTEETKRLASQEKATRIRAQAAEQEARGLAEAEKRARLTAQQETDRAQQLLYASQLRGALRSWNSGDWLRGITELAQTQIKHRGWEHRHLQYLMQNQGHLEVIPQGPPIVCLALSPDQRTLAVVRGVRTVTPNQPSNTIEVWDLLTKSRTRLLQKHTQYVSSLAFAPDGTRLLSGSRDGTACIWDVRTGQMLHHLVGHNDSVDAVIFSHDGKLAITAGYDKTARVWESSSGKLAHLIDGFQSPINGLAVNRKKGTLALVTGTPYLRVSGKPAAKKSKGDRRSSRGERNPFQLLPPTPQDPLQSVIRNVLESMATPFPSGSGTNTKLRMVIKTQFGNREFNLGSSPSPGEVCLWNLQSQTKERIRSYAGESFLSVAFNTKDQTLVTGQKHGSVRFFNAQLEELARPFQKHDASVCSLAVTPDGEKVLSGDDKGNLLIRHARTGVPFFRTQPHSGELAGIAIGVGGSWLVTGGADGVLTVRDPFHGHEPRAMRSSLAIRALAISPNGRRAALALHITKWKSKLHASNEHRNAERAIQVLDVDSGKRELLLTGHTKPIHCLAFSPDGSRILSGSEDRTAKLWDARTGTLLHTWTGHKAEVNAVAFSPDGRFALTGSADKTLKLYEVASGKEYRSMAHQASIVSVAFSPDGSRIASGGMDCTVKIWSIDKGTVLHALRGHGQPVSCLAFTPDGSQLVSGETFPATTDVIQSLDEVLGAAAFGPNDRTRSARLVCWDVESEKAIWQYRCGARSVHCLAITPDGQRLLYGNNKGTLRVLDTKTGDLMLTVQAHEGHVQTLALSSDGSRLLTGGSDKTIRIREAPDNADHYDWKRHLGMMQSSRRFLE